ncbi:MAG: OB-fold nucleic acid binding domain-containing protein, partial [Dehalococcoidia bacterium]
MTSSTTETSTTETQAWVAPLTKILELEDTNGFADKAVVGGLDRFLQRWAESLASFLGKEDGKDDLIQELVHNSYGEMSPSQRAKWAARWRSLLNSDNVKVSAGPENAPKKRSAAVSSPAAAEPSPSVRYKAPPAGVTVDATVDRLRGVDTKLSARLKRLEVSTVRDLLYLFPRRHLDYTKVVKIAELEPEQDCTVVGQLWEARQVSLGQKGRLKATEAVLSDDTGNIKIIWFGQGYLARSLKTNSRLAVSGKVEVYRGQPVFQSPEYEMLAPGQEPIHTGRLVPVYPLTEGLTARNMRRLTRQAVDSWLGGIEDGLPSEIINRVGVLPLLEAVRQAHYPDNLDSWASARRRLAFDELLTLQLAVLTRRRHRNLGVTGVVIEVDSKILDSFIASLPFPLTGAQQRCIAEILEDLKRGTP